jgi:hypothetical protein
VPSEKFVKPKDRENEFKVATAFCSWMKRQHHIDLSFSQEIIEMGSADLAFHIKRNDRLYAVGEAKCRNYKSNSFGEYMLSLAKFDKCISIARNAKVPCIFLFRFFDTAVAYHAKPEHRKMFELAMGGREPRKGAKNDREMCIWIPQEKYFAKFGHVEL